MSESKEPKLEEFILLGKVIVMSEEIAGRGVEWNLVGSGRLLNDTQSATFVELGM